MRYYALVLLFALVPAYTLQAQKAQVDIYKIKVVTVVGNRLYGTLEAVSENDLIINTADNRRSGNRLNRLKLSSVKRIVLRRRSGQKSAVQGAIVGGLAIGYVVVNSTPKNPFRSPVLYGVNLALAVAGGAAGGAILGNSISSSLSRKVIRPHNRDREDANEHLRRQLEPFTYSYQIDVLNRIQP
ncbi:hypothetical protein ACFSUS_13715 [Spirosoma soli]|uniref:Glycine zipper domain-containing protein n=1 Tax=Spirosoma soli TaxID=1770529 RepID=A0ABW5M541_9BACT